MKTAIIILASLCALLLLIGVLALLTVIVDLYEDFQSGRYCSEECPYIVRPEKDQDDE